MMNFEGWSRRNFTINYRLWSSPQPSSPSPSPSPIKTGLESDSSPSPESDKLWGPNDGNLRLLNTSLRSHFIEKRALEHFCQHSVPNKSVSLSLLMNKDSWMVNKRPCRSVGLY
jgi:hypothetical protein